MAWRVAYSLEQLLEQVNTLAPNRNRAADGSLGDAAHSARSSDHNPDATGVVRARDFTHDPAGGADMYALSEALRHSRDPRIKYVIFAGRIFDARSQFTPWQWQPYAGLNSHHHHMHVSVVADVRADSDRAWSLGAAVDALQEDDMANVTDAEKAKLLAAADQILGGVAEGQRNYAGTVQSFGAKLGALINRVNALSGQVASVGGRVDAAQVAVLGALTALDPGEADAWTDEERRRWAAEIAAQVHLDPQVVLDAMATRLAS